MDYHGLCLPGVQINNCSDSVLLFWLAMFGVFAVIVSLPTTVYLTYKYREYIKGSARQAHLFSVFVWMCAGSQRASIVIPHVPLAVPALILNSTGALMFVQTAFATNSFLKVVPDYLIFSSSSSTQRIVLLFRSRYTLWVWTISSIAPALVPWYIPFVSDPAERLRYAQLYAAYGFLFVSFTSLVVQQICVQVLTKLYVEVQTVAGEVSKNQGGLQVETGAHGTQSQHSQTSYASTKKKEQLKIEARLKNIVQAMTQARNLTIGNFPTIIYIIAAFDQIMADPNYRIPLWILSDIFLPVTVLLSTFTFWRLGRSSRLKEMFVDYTASNPSESATESQQSSSMDSERGLISPHAMTPIRKSSNLPPVMETPENGV